ncbi:MAG: hypothetical protein NC320_04130 [Clostridium sp.]|nr:hypothetical protein [Clostridium sp.]MCM1547254.1 hypothetical protein [Ruminococcus sp.]
MDEFGKSPIENEGETETESNKEHKEGSCEEIPEEVNDKKGKRNGTLADVFFMQLTICIILLIALAVSNIIFPGIAEEIRKGFSEFSVSVPEDIFEKAVAKAVDTLR